MWKDGETDGTAIRSAVRRELETEPLIGDIDYVSLAAPKTLEELATAHRGAMLSVAAHMGSVRLIDNVILE